VVFSQQVDKITMPIETSADWGTVNHAIFPTINGLSRTLAELDSRQE
jgi:hypothetical protein